MKRLTLILLALTLAGCNAFQVLPNSTVTPQPTVVPPTPQVIIATVLVTVIPTQAPTDTPPPTETPSPTLPPPTETATLEMTASPTPESGEVEVPASFYGNVFSKITFSTNIFSLRCEPKIITFDVTVANTNISNVEFYYRIRDKNSTYVPDWSRGDNLKPDGTGHFRVDYYSSDVVPDNRKVLGWFDVQFVGLNTLGQVVGRSGKIENLITYSLDCQ